MHHSRLSTVVIDCQVDDLDPASTFWSQALGMPFSIALFCGNVVSTVSLALLVPVLANRMGWWLRPEGAASRWTDAAGAILVVALYAALLAVFTIFF